MGLYRHYSREDLSERSVVELALEWSMIGRPLFVSTLSPNTRRKDDNRVSDREEMRADHSIDAVTENSSPFIHNTGNVDVEAYAR